MMIETAFPRKIDNNDCSLFWCGKSTSLVRNGGGPVIDGERSLFSKKNSELAYKKIPWGGAALFIFMGFSVLSLASLTSLTLFLG